MSICMQVHVRACAHQKVENVQCAAVAAAALRIECSHSTERLMLASGIDCRIRAGRLESFGSPAQVYMTALASRVA